ncbi:hypothetical protein Taro_056333, partial [Colocasia esculenta]|nr:hypothetical protein [Colocasia esculenta]
AMASRGRCSTQALEDEQRCEERGEQQVPAPQGPTVLPPPPPVDYGVFMQGLAQALAPIPQEHGHGGPSIMERFKRMALPSFKGESQPLLAESWMREVEKIFRAIRLVAFDHRTLDEALSAACREESEMDQYIEEKRAAQKRSAPPFQRQDKKKAVVYQSPQRPAALSQQMVVPQTPSFRPSDKKIDCPRLQQFTQRGALDPAAAATAAPVTGRPGRPQAQARVFALPREDTKQAENIMKGTVLVMGMQDQVLFNTDDTHSFISEQFAKQLAAESGVEAEELEVPLSVHMSAGTVATRKCIPSLTVCIEEQGLFGCCYLLKMKDYDAVLGLDWLEEHYALVDYRGKKITLRIPGEDEFAHPLPRNLAGRFVISAMKVGGSYVVVYFSGCVWDSRLETAPFSPEIV